MPRQTGERCGPPACDSPRRRAPYGTGAGSTGGTTSASSTAGCVWSTTLRATIASPSTGPVRGSLACTTTLSSASRSAAVGPSPSVSATRSFAVVTSNASVSPTSPPLRTLALPPLTVKVPSPFQTPLKTYVASLTGFSGFAPGFAPATAGASRTAAPIRAATRRGFLVMGTASLRGVGIRSAGSNARRAPRFGQWTGLRHSGPCAQVLADREHPGRERVRRRAGPGAAAEPRLERRERVPVQPAGHLPRDDVERLLDRQRPAVRAVGRERLEDVGDG